MLHVLFITSPLNWSLWITCIKLVTNVRKGIFVIRHMVRCTRVKNLWSKRGGLRHKARRTTHVRNIGVLSWHIYVLFTSCPGAYFYGKLSNWAPIWPCIVDHCVRALWLWYTPRFFRSWFVAARRKQIYNFYILGNSRQPYDPLAIHASLLGFIAKNHVWYILWPSL